MNLWRCGDGDNRLGWMILSEVGLPTLSCSRRLMTMDYEGCCQTFKACKLQLKRRNTRSTSVH
ncbi:hypothetical protein [Microcoleus sp. B3-A4]|uniref:hypothetical protein n=1 Tax=Microcoleus sp. B3-A4 TaxID=2818653 RepID=UPI002FD1652A